MFYEFFGKTMQEAIKKAVRDLDLKEGEFDVEVLEKEKIGFFFKKEMVKIRVYPHNKDYGKDVEQLKTVEEIEDSVYELVMNFVKDIILKMGYTATLTIEKKDNDCVKILIDTNNPSILIGREGKNLDALQLIINIYFLKLVSDKRNFNKIVLDIEDYRERYKSKFINLAINSFHKVKRTKHPILLQPMNPFERRIIHITLSRYNDIKTESEGIGRLRRVKISYIKNNYSNYDNTKRFRSRG